MKKCLLIFFLFVFLPIVQADQLASHSENIKPERLKAQLLDKSSLPAKNDESVVGSSSRGQKIESEKHKEPPGVEYSPLSNFLKMFAGLLFVVLIFLGSAWVLKRLQSGLPNQQAEMKTLAAMALGNRERVVLVEVAGVQMVLGVAPGSVTLLHTFDEPVVNASDAAGQGAFAAKLSQIMSSKK